MMMKDLKTALAHPAADLAADAAGVAVVFLLLFIGLHVTAPF